MSDKVKRNRLTLEQFIELGNKCHNGKYSYDKAQIVDAYSEVIVTCPDHGDFKLSSARSHYSGSYVGCSECTGYIKNDLERFIKRSQAVHGDKYDYSKSIYKASGKKLLVTCPLHGDFEVRPSAHYGPTKSGCRACSGKKKLTTTEFILRARSIHGSKYSYQNTEFVGTVKKVTITCSIHGDFTIRASEHIGGPKRGCTKCTVKSPSNKGRMNTERFIKFSKEIHDDKYDYSKSAYTGAHNKIVITCPIHGDFSIRASSHYGKSASGCSACGGRGDVTSQNFIDKSKKKFSNRFDYSKVKYVNAHSNVIIICKEHGAFSTRPNNHLNGNGGCGFCSGRADITTESLVERLKAHLGEQYDYSLVKYNGRLSNITLVCPIHGAFTGLPQVLLKVKGCPDCNTYNFDDFLKKALEVHGEKYNYSETKYKSARELIIVNCLKHGDFEQTANRHLSGRGCPTCGIESNLLANRNPNDGCILYYLTLNYKGHDFWKIGITTRDVKTRYHLLHRDNVTIENAITVNTTIGKAIEAENNLIREYEDYLEYRGHILKHAKGGTETFSIDVLKTNNKSLQDFI